MQMALTIQLPKEQGGSEGECVYIDTEGSFNALRLQKMAERFNLKDPLKKIHVFRVLNHTEFVAIIMQLTEILTNRTRVKLVIIDSMAYHLRINALPFRARIEFLNFAGPHLIKIAQNLTVSVSELYLKNSAIRVLTFDRLWLQITLQQAVSTINGHRRWGTSGEIGAQIDCSCTEKESLDMDICTSQWRKLKI